MPLSPPAPRRRAAIIAQMPAAEPAVLADIIHAYGTAQYYDYELLTVRP